MARFQIKSKNDSYDKEGSLVLPRDFITRMVFYNYRVNDLKTYVIAVFSLRQSVLLNLLVGSMLYVSMKDNFITLNKYTTFLIVSLSVFFSFLKYGFDKRFPANDPKLFRIIFEMAAMPLFFFLIYFCFYFVLVDKIPQDTLYVYLYYVVLNSFLSGIYTIFLSHVVVSILKLYNRVAI